MVGDSRRRQKVGGTIIALRRLEWTCLFLALLGFMALSKAIEVKKNYTSLHDKVNKLEYLHKGDSHE